jgi:hypothetical protein
MSDKSPTTTSSSAGSFRLRSTDMSVNRGLAKPPFQRRQSAWGGLPLPDSASVATLHIGNIKRILTLQIRSMILFTRCFFGTALRSLGGPPNSRFINGGLAQPEAAKVGIPWLSQARRLPAFFPNAEASSITIASHYGQALQGFEVEKSSAKPTLPGVTSVNARIPFHLLNLTGSPRHNDIVRPMRGLGAFRERPTCLPKNRRLFGPIYGVILAFLPKRWPILSTFCLASLCFHAYGRAILHL